MMRDHHMSVFVTEQLDMSHATMCSNGTTPSGVYDVIMVVFMTRYVTDNDTVAVKGPACKTRWVWGNDPNVHVILFH